MLRRSWRTASSFSAAAGLSLTFVVQWWLEVPIAGSPCCSSPAPAFLSSRSRRLASLSARSRPPWASSACFQIPVLLVLMLLSGSTTPMESMPVWLQYLMKVISPTPHFVEFAKMCSIAARIFRIVWPQMAAVAALGAVYFGVHPAPLPPRYFRKLKHVAAVAGGLNAGGHPERRQWVLRET